MISESRVTDEVTCVVDCHDQLGEGPVWDERTGTLYWLDIYGQILHAWNPASGEKRDWPLPERVGFIIPRQRGGFVIGMHSGLAWLELPSATITRLSSPEPDVPGNRFNDAKCDNAGRLWAGTMDNACKEPSGWLYRYQADLGHQRTDGGYIITNGPAFSADCRTMYHTDTSGKVTYVFAVDAAGTLSGKRVFHRYSAEEGNPDGMTVDAENHLWVAMFGSSRVLRFAPSGALVRTVFMPVSNMTSLVFAGSDWSTLYATSATLMLDQAALARQPLAGGLFRINANVRGLPTCRFAG